jgi:hypothetical protein
LERLNGGVRIVWIPSPLGAFNSAYCFKTRAEIALASRACAPALKPDGVFFLDAFGGPDIGIRRKIQLDGFTYVWDKPSSSP